MTQPTVRAHARLFGAVFALVLSWLFCVSAYAKPLEARSDSFIVYGNVSEASARDLLYELETYRSAILQHMGADTSAEIMPVKIYLASGPKEIEKLTGAAGSGGVYLSQIGGPVFVLNSRSGFRSGKQALKIALHEYTHHMMASFIDVHYPRWFDEGFAEYLSTFKTDKDGNIIIGRPDQDHAYALKNIRWLPFEVLLGSVRRYPFPNDSSRNTQLLKSVFYAQSWIAVHYIQSTPGYPERLAQYIRLLNSPNTPKNAFDQAFGMTPTQFGEILKAYYARNRFLSVTIKLPKTRDDIATEIDELSKPELALHMAEATRHFRPSAKGLDAAQRFYEKAVEDPALKQRVNLSKAEFYSALGEHDKAAALIKPVLDGKPHDSDVNRAAGMIWYAKNDHDAAPDPGEIAAARALLKKAMRANPDNIPAHHYYVQTYIIARDDPSPQAVSSAATSLSYYRSVNFVDSNVDYAEILMKAGKKGEAVLPLKKALAWSRNRSVRSYAFDHLRRIEAE